LEKNGFIEVRTTKQLYSLDDERFLPDRYVVGTCPYCGYERARGDQCENCTNVLDPTQLIEPRSAISGSRSLEVRESEHIFLLQSKLVDELDAWIGSHEDWPVLVTSIARKWLTEGVEDRSITRDLHWGVPVAKPGFEGKVYYVWFDAPIEYIAATKEWADSGAGRDWQSWWWESDDVKYVQFMAKDNIPFHTIGFPSTLLGSREPWHLVDYIKGFNWLNYYGGKFSTSQGVGVFMTDALELLPADYWRFYLTHQAPETADSSFTWETFAEITNKALVGSFGNFVNRSVRLTAQRFGGAVVPEGGDAGSEEQELHVKLAEVATQYSDHLLGTEFRKAAQALREAWRLGNTYLERKAPWEKADDDVDVAVTLRTALNLIPKYALMASPIVPATADYLLECFEITEGDRRWPAQGWYSDMLAAGSTFEAPELLFRKITKEEVAEWTERFGGGSDPSDSEGS
jgi:methionyl-tRNA synthetase